eukprot:485520-Rhodomonas_salina.4
MNDSAASYGSAASINGSDVSVNGSKVRPETTRRSMWLPFCFFMRQCWPARDSPRQCTWLAETVHVPQARTGRNGVHDPQIQCTRHAETVHNVTCRNSARDVQSEDCKETLSGRETT